MNPLLPQLRHVPSHRRSSVMAYLGLQRFKQANAQAEAPAGRPANPFASRKPVETQSFSDPSIPMELQLMPVAQVLLQISRDFPDSPSVVASQRTTFK